MRFRTKFKLAYACAFSALFLLTSCTHLMFVPTKHHVQDPSNLGISYDDVFLQTTSGATIHGWMLKAALPKKGNVVFLHGNGENISTHVNTIAWATRFGYDVFIYDYEGYAKSTGSPNLAHEIENVDLALDYAAAHSEGPTILYGQSLGGAIASSALTSPTTRAKVSLLVIESAFPNFRRIVQNMIAAVWPVWPLQWPLSWAFVSNQNPEDGLGQLSPIPALIVHGMRDRIIPYDNALELLRDTTSPSARWTIRDGGHIMAALCSDFHQELIKLFDSVTDRQNLDLSSKSFDLPPSVIEILRARRIY